MNVVENIIGLQHIGIPVRCLEESIEFYKRLGFSLEHKKTIDRDEMAIQAAFMSIKGLVLEFYQLEGDAYKEVLSRGDGHIDHIALDVTCIESMFEHLKTNGYNLLDTEIQFIPFFEKGVSFVTILGPDNERIEFNQRL